MSRMKARRARRASPMVKPVEATLRLAYFHCLLLCNLFQTPGSLCKKYYLLIRNISSIYHIVAMCVIKHPGHTCGPRRWLSRCLCLTRRGRWPDPLPSSCSLGWWHQHFTAECEVSRSHDERSADECSAPPPHPGSVPSPSREYPFSPRRP
jgi:hypothetical protein